LYETIEQVLAQMDGPIPVSEFAARVLAIYPSKARNPMASIRSQLRSEHPGKTLVFLDHQTIVPLHVAMRGVRFRIPLTREEVTRGMLRIDPAFAYFHPQRLAPQEMQLLDGDGSPLAARVETLQQHVKGPLGSYTHEDPAFDLGDWCRAHRVRRNDSLLVTIEDWERGRYRLEHEPAKQRREPEIERQNQELADRLFDLLEASSRVQLFAHQALPTAYARLSDPRDYPGDHWTQVIARDGRMRSDGLGIYYSDVRSPFDDMLRFGERADRRHEEPYSQALARQVYRFTASLQHRPGLWRRLEIQGGQTLADFDAILRDAFQPDRGDHLGGFRKQVRQGTGRRFREVKLGDIDPLGEGSGAEQHLAGLGLTPGDELKYVYDFGDWIEHRIILDEIAEPEARASYPRIVAQNKPRYQHCQTCQDKGRKTVATWMCIECSNEQHQRVLVCKKCLTAEHEEHYADEVVY
jgi:hypothetical protein